MPSSMDLDTAAKELYGLPPGQFTARRNALAAEARDAGEGASAEAIRKLRRPTTSAWLANLLVRERGDRLADLLDLGAELREAQAQLNGELLVELSTQRQRVVSALGNEAVQIAKNRGERVGDEAERELEASLEAAMADPAAAEAIRSGRLTSALHYSGLGPVDVSGAVAQPAPTAEGRPRRPTARAEAERAWKTAHAAELEARREVDRRKQQLHRAEANRDDLIHQVREAEGHLERLRNAERAAEDALRDAQEAMEMASQEAEAAEERAAEARARADQLRQH